MKKVLLILLLIVFILGAFGAASYFINSNKKSIETFETATPFKSTIITKTVAAGTVIPEDEVEIKPQISGIIEKIFVEEGDKIKTGDLIARIKVVPNEQSLNSAKNRIKNSRIVVNNAKIAYDRNKTLFDKGIISSQEFERAELSYSQSKQELSNAQSDLQIIKKGSVGGSSANTNIRATVSGTILMIPVKEGDQVIESNTFNAGTSIATIADLGKMIFEGKVDEAEVGKLKPNSELTVSLGAIEGKEFAAKLTFVAPKGVEESGAVQFKIKADVALDDDYFIRAGYSANASIELEKKEDILVIDEALLRFDAKNEDKPYVEIETGDQKFEKKFIELGISDGKNIEVLSGLKEEDKIKIWNIKAAKKDEEGKSDSENEDGESEDEDETND
ncbi:efflux RND transporter periplasmic adaptor subunit [Kordia sp. YSTF-M3]|uniref:Efflux RND transporter periplasmic adaptor subunit n=1 Tax=Kordia aestuariivivens TaxID=2759037 RepID=A0ABR7Q3H6_9FLAO|nr:efflux RND transporter periplasmic adaptor subunit [Kordia aestuariivivens]MBC8753100.1 efflux RND transporter periplasmic adaptor subunit [Kordia aestuariivivens]